MTERLKKISGGAYNSSEAWLIQNPSWTQGSRDPASKPACSRRAAVWGWHHEHYCMCLQSQVWARWSDYTFYIAFLYWMQIFTYILQTLLACELVYWSHYAMKYSLGISIFPSTCETELGKILTQIQLSLVNFYLCMPISMANMTYSPIGGIWIYTYMISNLHLPPPLPRHAYSDCITHTTTPDAFNKSFKNLAKDPLKSPKY